MFGCDLIGDELGKRFSLVRTAWFRDPVTVENVRHSFYVSPRFSVMTVDVSFVFIELLCFLQLLNPCMSIRPWLDLLVTSLSNILERLRLIRQSASNHGANLPDLHRVLIVGECLSINAVHARSYLLRLRPSHSCWSIGRRDFTTDSDHLPLYEHHYSWLASAVNLPGMFVARSSLDVLFFSCLHQVPIT